MPNPSTLLEGSDYDGNESAHSTFDFDTLDSIEDQIREAISRGESVTALVATLVEDELSERTNEAIARVLCLIADTRKPKLTIDYIAYATGMRLTQGEAASSLARKHRITKQAFSQAALKLIRKLGLKPSRAMRSLKGRESMPNAYRERAGRKQ